MKPVVRTISEDVGEGLQMSADVTPPNEALNLRAADAAAVADAADNPASKRRHRGPQLSAGALGLHPLDA